MNDYYRKAWNELRKRALRDYLSPQTPFGQKEHAKDILIEMQRVETEVTASGLGFEDENALQFFLTVNNFKGEPQGEEEPELKPDADLQEAVNFFSGGAPVRGFGGIRND